MLKKLFVILTFLTLFSIIFFAVHIGYNRSSTITFLNKYYAKGHEKNAFSWLMEKQELQVRVIQSENSSVDKKGTNESKANIKNEESMSSKTHRVVQERIKIPSPVNKTIGPCPDTPPNLVGPLRVEFDETRTLDQVREEVGSPLQMGGRFKPLDCVSQQKVAIIIPFRNRHLHLKYWLYYLHPILIRQQVDYGVYVINQDGEGVFNRAKLMNVGYAEAVKEYDYDCFVFSDVDLIPLNDHNLYRCFDKPRHLAVAMDKFGFSLPYEKFFGGVSSLSKKQFLSINGFPNSFWGWGGEDDNIYIRITSHKMSISRPDLWIGRYKMIKHQRDLHNEVNPENPDKLWKTKWTMDQDGINSLKYTVKEIVKNKLYTFITVDIQAPSSSRRKKKTFLQNIVDRL